MATRKLEKAEWRSFLDGISGQLQAKEAEIEVASLNLGGQIAADWLPLIGVTYDPKDDLVEVALDGVDHMIRKPREIYLQSDGGALTGIEITGGDGANQIVKFRDALLLPPPAK